ncbi:MAG: ABC transporter permease subunit [Deltaproteobacteria bacterium]|nr:ABC transporter permease subunit [Deltaproteobacteria bacterium]
MTKALLVARRELGSYARSPLGAVILAGALLIDGILFYYFGLSKKMLSAEVLTEFFYAASGVQMAASLVLSMRLIAEERQTHTFTLLNTAPIADWEIVLGKYLSALGMLGLLTALTLYMPALIFVNGKVSIGHIAVGYTGLFLIGSATIAIGLFASALTRSQVVAVIVGAAILAALILMWMLASAAEPPLNSFLAGLAFHHQNYQPFQKGILELRGVAYYVAVTYFFLLSATKILEARRWR